MHARRAVLAATISGITLAGCGSLLPAGHQVKDTAELAEGNYRLDPDHATVMFRVNHLGFSTYVGRFNTASASLNFNPAAPEASSLDVTIDIASIDTPSDKLDDILKGDGWFDAARFPTARFVSRIITVTGQDRGTVLGDLTLHGITRAVELSVTFNGGANNLLTGKHTLGFAAIGMLKRSEFGISSLSPAIGEEVELEIHAEFQRIDG